MIEGIEHLGIACRDLKTSTKFWRDILGLEYLGCEEVSEQRVRVAFLRVGDTSIELLEPTDVESPIAKFISSRGEGFHHIAFRVGDLVNALGALGESGLEVIGGGESRGAHGSLVAFLHPKSTGGILVELCQQSESEEKEKTAGKFRNPFPTVDIVINVAEPGEEPKIVLIKRRNPPEGWALPGGFIDYGESAEDAAVREAGEETCLDVRLTGLLGVYSDPERDPRFHTLSIVFTADGAGEPRAADDAAEVAIVSEEEIPEAMAFDHALILEDYFRSR